MKFLEYSKAYASLIGSIATALLAVYTESEVLVVISIVATVYATWQVPNVEEAGDHRGEPR